MMISEPMEENMPAMMSLGQGVLPDIKDWKVGEKYTLHLNVKQVGSRIMEYGPHKGKIMADFHILEAKSGSEKKLLERY